jgi:sulfur carrier protein
MDATIRVNGTDEAFCAGTVDLLVAQKAELTGRKGIAVALNGVVVPRAAWANTALNPGDRVEIVRVLQGG